MENFNGGGTYRNHLWYVVFAAFVFSFFLFFFDSSTLLATKNVVQTKKNYVDSVSSLSPVPKRIGNIFRKDMEPLNQIDLGPGENLVKQKIKPVQEKDPCSGKYIYVHTLPRKFNSDMLKECQTLCGWIDMCLYLLNQGLGPKLDNKTKGEWFATDQFALDVIFHKRMMQYKCLTKNSSLASAIYVPFYAGLDVGRYLWTYNATLRDSASQSLVKWLTSKPEWQVMGGRDHFMVAGRITWDFRRLTDKDTDWGNNLMVLPETKNMTMLVLESSPWHSNDFAIPYPTYFHPSSDNEVFQWQNRMRRHKKKYLYSFAGAPRPNLVDSIRGQIIEQCQRSKGKCKLLECSKADDYCHSPVPVMKMFQDSVFCLQPPGDSYTRRSAFDSILAGCIPVFFHPGSAYVQYTWHLPLNYTRYSVFIPADEVRTGKVKIETVLSRVSKDDVRAMKEEVIGLIPKLVYADPRARLKTVEDAFDMSVKGVIEKVNEVRRKGWVSPTYIEEENYWKYSLFGTVEKHEWDRFFIYN